MATLIKMNFPSIWVSYVKICLEATSFYILINGNPSNWFQPHRGVRQGDPLSNDLNHNFNHLLYADDLILVNSASRKSARNIGLCLNIYAHISGQFPNQNKSDVYIPYWFNNRVSSRICNILNFKLGNTPFTYLGVLISPKKLAISHFEFMISCINVAIADWSRANLSKAGKSVLIDSILMATPTYYMLVYPIPDSILTKFSRVARKFLWDNHEHGNDMHMVNWDILTANKSEGGLGIRNLFKVKHSLMAKNLINYLNRHNAFWVGILYLKYGNHNFGT